MHPKIEFEGKQIGDWTVLHEVPKEGSRFRRYLCRCKCGTEHIFHVPYISTHKMTCCENCQEKHRRVKEEQIIKDTIGKKRGDYTIMEYKGKTKWGSRLWLCRCKCGVERVYTTGQIFNQGTQRSRCENCYSDDMELSNRVLDYIPNRFWKRLCDSAKRRGISITITKEDAFQLYTQQNKCCALTGDPLFFTSLRSRFNRYTNASLDRISSEKGYEKDNIQWVHKTVNLMKGLLPQIEFLSWCQKIALKHRSGG